MQGIELREVQPLLQQHGYLVVEEIGKGGFSVIYKVYSEKYSDYFVAKVVSSQTEQNILLYDTELRSLKLLDHPNIIRLYDTFTNHMFCVLILELCYGNLEKRVHKNGPLRGTEFEKVTSDVVSALVKCHSLGISHRDIKASNLLLDRNGRVKLADFGLSKQSFGDRSVRYFCGSLPFIAPELFEPNTRINPFSADIWSLGITLYFLLTGKLPFLGKTNEEMSAILKKQTKPEFPDFVENNHRELVLSMLEFNPENRPSIIDMSKRIRGLKLETPIKRSPIRRNIPKPISMSPANKSSIPKILVIQQKRRVRSLFPTRPYSKTPPLRINFIA